MIPHPTLPKDNARNKRDNTIDILKGICIILVVYGHMARGLIDSGISNHKILLTEIDFVLYTSHMPVFFLIAGYNTEYSIRKHHIYNFLRSRLWAVIYPYFLWSTILWLTKSVTSLFLSINHPIQIIEILDIFWNPISVFWFLYALFFLQSFSTIFRSAGVLLLTISFLLLTIFFIFNPNLPRIINLIVVHSPFFAIGFLASQLGKTLIIKKLSYPMPLFLLFILFTIGCYEAITSGLPTPVGFATLPLSIMGIALLIGISQACPTAFLRNHIRFLGVLSLPIYLLHVYFLPIVPRILPKLHVHSDIIAVIAGTGLGVYGSVLTYMLIKRLNLDGWCALSGKPPLEHSQESPEQIQRA